MLNKLKRTAVSLFAVLMLLTSAFAGLVSADQIAMPAEDTSGSNIVFASAEEMPRKKRASRSGKRSRKKRKALTGGEDIEKPKDKKDSLKEKNKGGKKSTSWWKKLFAK
ncbi:hypothetical protein HOG81_06990, partial [bacterium]|nr:hypothetical protein [bacterium]